MSVIYLVYKRKGSWDGSVAQDTGRRTLLKVDCSRRCRGGGHPNMWGIP